MDWAYTLRMRYFFALTAFLALAASSPATAQMYPGQDVTVNTAAAGRQVLLYPGGQYMRVVPALREPRYVRYGWANFPEVNLFNAEGLAAAPFRSE